MEFPRRGLIVERLLAAALLAAALGAAWVENGSPLAAREREGRPWLAWVAARPRGAAAGTPPSFHLAVYEPARRRLSLVHVPLELKLEGRRTLERAYRDALKAGPDEAAAERAAEDAAEARLRALAAEPVPEVSARLSLDVSPPAPEDEPSLETIRALKAGGRSPRAWASLARRAARGLLAGDRAAADPLLFALELRRVPVESLRPARLPDDASVPGFFGRLLSGDAPPGDGRATAVEVLNCAGAPGLASRAEKVLRSHGVDVLSTGSAPSRARTLVYDRVGDFARAEGARAALGCPSARSVTRLDPSRAVDASIELGSDCAGAFGTAGGREP